MSGKNPRLGFEIFTALTVKAVLLTALYYVCFGPSHQIRVDAQKIDQHLFSSPSPTAIR
jgi:hypothetical protein